MFLEFRDKLGLSEEELKALRGRLSRLGTGGTLPAPGRGAAFGLPIGGGDTFIFNGDIVTPDPEEFVRKVQRKAKRSAGSRRGTRPGQNRGLG